MRNSFTFHRALVGALLALAGLAACGGDPAVTSSKSEGGNPITVTATDAPPVTDASGGFPDATVPTEATLPDLSVPDLSIPDLSLPDLSLPVDVTLPDLTSVDDAIDQLIAVMESSGITVDRDCVTELMNDPATREKFSGEGDISPELVQQFTACFKFG